MSLLCKYSIPLLAACAAGLLCACQKQQSPTQTPATTQATVQGDPRPAGPGTAVLGLPGSQPEDPAGSLESGFPVQVVHSDEELREYAAILATQPLNMRQQLLADGALLSPDYLVKYIDQGRTGLVVRMIASGMDLNEPVRDGMRPLAQAVLANDPWLVEQMILKGADPLLPDDPRNGVSRSLLHYAARVDSPALVQRFIELGIPVDQTDMLNKTALEVAAYYGCTAALRCLLENGADPRRDDGFGILPVMHAAMMGRTEVLQVLREHGAELDCRHREGWTPLLMAVYYNHEGTARYLIREGADISSCNSKGLGAAALAMTVHNPALLKLVLDSGAPVDGLNQAAGQNLVHMCVLYDMPEFIPELVACGVDPRLQDSRGQTPMDLAVEGGNKEAQRILVELGVDLPTDAAATAEPAEGSGALSS